MRHAALVLMFLLGACKNGNDGLVPMSSPSEGGASSRTDQAFPAEPPPEAALEGACSWPFVSDPDLLNVAFPDEAATYWVTALPAIPGSRLRIEGQFPQARYFSFNVYDPQLRPVDAITDYELLPRVPGTNPYRNSGAAAGGDYVAYIAPEPKSEEAAPNTLYSASVTLPGGTSLPLNPLPLLIYRIYLPEGNGNGAVSLPKLTYETADGSAAPLSLSLCQPLPPDGIPGVLNDLIREASFPLSAAAPSGPAEAPRVNRFYNLFESGRVVLSSLLGVELPGNPLTEGGGGGFLSNVDNAYVSALFRRDEGPLYVVRAKAPSYAQIPTDAPLGSAQLRYWSLCTNEFATQRFVACLADFQMPLDRHGYFTLVVSDPDQRPGNAVPENGIAWLPWGGLYPDSLLIYRHMLPNASFAEAIQNIPFGTPPQDVMGEYFPRVSYCDRATVESAGTEPAAIFAACARP
ncbi:MAG: hypothetical protein ACRETN_06480 [Nevskiales bacterium]